jgi:site-specific DNA-methyltransferase (adenine-specific)
VSKLSLGVQKAAQTGTVVDIGPNGRYVELDRKVDAAEGDGIMARWEFGREVLAERVGKQLPKGRLDAIAEAIGKSRAEVGLRALFASRFPDRQQVANAISNFGSWYSIVNDALASKGQLADRDRRAREITPGGDDAQGEGWAIFAGDFTVRGNDLPDDSVDLILTDPPYPEEFAESWDDLAAFAARVLVPGGIIAALSGKIHVDDRMDRLAAAGLQYGWIYSQPLPGSNTRILARHVLQEWKPWLCYSNGPWPSGRVDWNGDLLVADARAKDEYEWQQQLGPAVQLVERLTRSGDMVVDPFCGSGTYGVAALNAGRRFTGIEADADRVAISTRRLRESRP